jgi:putative transposase
MCFRKSRCEWVLSLPKRLRYFRHHEPALIGPVLRIFLDAVEDRLKISSPGALAEARFHRFGSALNANLHFHCAVIDGVFGAQGERVQFHEARLLCPADIAAVQRAARTRVLRLFARPGLIPPEAGGRDAANGSTGGLLSRCRGPHRGHGPEGVERLLRYCAARSLRASGCSGRSRPRAGDRDGPCMPRRGCSI